MIKVLKHCFIKKNVINCLLSSSLYNNPPDILTVLATAWVIGVFLVLKEIL
jgi:hypothetical protein